MSSLPSSLVALYNEYLAVRLLPSKIHTAPGRRVVAMEFFFCLFFFPLIFAKPNPIFTLGFSTRVFLSTTVVVTVMTMIWRLFEIRQTLHLLSSSSTPPPRSLAVLDASAMPPPDFGAVWRGIVDSSGTTQSMSPLFKMVVPRPGQEVVVLGARPNLHPAEYYRCFPSFACGCIFPKDSFPDFVKGYCYWHRQDPRHLYH